MFAKTKAFSGSADDDVRKAREFYGETLGIRASEKHGLMTCTGPATATRSCIRRPDDTPATSRRVNWRIAAPFHHVPGVIDRVGTRVRARRFARRRGPEPHHFGSGELG
jgi:hypothetical protein